MSFLRLWWFVVLLCPLLDGCSGSPRAEPVAPTSSSLDSSLDKLGTRSGRPRARAHGQPFDCAQDPSGVEGVSSGAEGRPWPASRGRQTQHARPVSHETRHPSLEEQVQSFWAQLHHAQGGQAEAMVIDQLEALGPHAIPFIEVRLASSNRREQMLALVVLQRLNAQRSAQDFSEEMVRRYLAQLSDPQVIVRTYAMESLIRAGSRFRAAMEQHRTTADADVQYRLDIVLREMR